MGESGVLRDVAARRAAWHSSAANFDNAAHLATGGSSGFLAEGVEAAWVSGGGGEEWLCVDLGADSELVSARVWWGDGYARSYRLEVSPDGKAWSVAASASGAADALVESPLGNAGGRFFRVLCEGCSGPRYVIRKIEVDGRNGLPDYVLPPPPPFGTGTLPETHPLGKGTEGAEDGTQRLSGGNWKVERASLVGASGEILSREGFDDSSWLPAQVPGTALVSWLRAGAIPDPDYDDWQFQVSEAFFTADFWYRNHFEIPESMKSRRVFLNFDSINWKADVYFNGRFLPNPNPARGKSIEGAFVRGRFEVTPWVNFGGENYLGVLVYRNDTPGAVTTQGLAEGPLPNGGALGADNPTIHAAVGWDWLPTIRGRDIGIFEDVFLSYSGDVGLLDPWMETRLAVAETDAALSSADIALGADVSVSSDQGYSPEELACLIDDNPRTQWIGADGDGAGFTVDLGERRTVGSVTIVWGIEAGGRAADLESRYAAKFSLESSLDGKNWVNFNAFPGGEIDAMWFGRLQVGPNGGTDLWEGHAISDSVQGSTAVAMIDLAALGWGTETVPIPFFAPQKARYLRFTARERRSVNGAPVPVRIQQFRVYAESPQQVEQSLVRHFSLDDSKAELVFRTEVENRNTVPVTAVVRGRVLPGDAVFEKTLSLEAGATRSVEIGDIFIDQPRLWWPNTYGEQFLYTAEITAEIGGDVSDAKSFRFGVRQFSYPVDGDMLTLYCNGTRIVCKGGNWGMDDGLKRDTPETYDSKVRLHAEENLTMIRNWVGMTNHRGFYDACDKYGLLVWDDFWLANPVDGPDPNDFAMFLDNAVDKIRRVRGHAALALYCGRNESAPPPELDAGLRERTAAHDGTRFYFPNSAGPPVGSGGGYSLAAPGAGVKQYFNDVTSPVLRSERGIPNVPSLESIRKFVSAEKIWPISEVWALHDWTYHMNGPANTYMSTLKCFIDGDFTVPVDTIRDQNPKAEDPAFQAYKGEVLRMVAGAGKAYTIGQFDRMAQMINFEHHRGLFEALTVRRSNGLLMWMSQSSWPSFMWQTYDWYLETNGGYFGVKAGNQPTHPVWDPRDDSILLVNASPRGFSDLNVRVTIFDLQGTIVSAKEYGVETLGPDSYGVFVAKADFSVSPTDLVFIKLALKDSAEKLLGENLYWHNRAEYQNYRDLDTLPQVDLRVSVSPEETLPNGNVLYRIKATNATKTPALQNRIRITCGGKDLLPVFYSDNYFALMPGESRTVTAEFNPELSGGGLPEFHFRGWNTAEKTVSP